MRIGDEMNPSEPLREITLRVPGPFAGIEDLGFSAMYPSQSRLEPQRDVPVWIEGPPDPMRRLTERLTLLADLVRSAHSWTRPVRITDEVVVISFHHLSAADPATAVEVDPAFDHLVNLVRPVVFPFLQDCAQVAGLRLTDPITISVRHDEHHLAELALRRDQITPANGDYRLFA